MRFDLVTRDIVAISVGVAFNMIISLLPPPLNSIIHFLIPYFMFIFIETIALHKRSVILLVTLGFSMQFYAFYLPRYDLVYSLASFISNPIVAFFKALGFSDFSYDPSFITVLFYVVAPINYLGGYFGAKETVEKLRLKERLGI